MKEINTATSYDVLPVVAKSAGMHVIAFNERVIRGNTVVYEYDIATCDNDLTYGDVVAGIVSARYTADDVTAIMLNLLNRDADPDKYAEYQQEAEELQQWRTVAKRVAKEVIAYLG